MTRTLTTTDARARRAALDLPYTHVDDLYLDGSWVTATDDARSEVTDPATGEVWGSVPVATAEELDTAVAAARRALPGWGGLTAAERARYLLRIADEVEARAEALALTNTRENGSPVAETRGAAANAAGIFRYFATLAEWLDREDLRPFPAGGAESLVDRDPIGVCGLIAPWNFPINLGGHQTGPRSVGGLHSGDQTRLPHPTVTALHHRRRARRRRAGGRGQPAHRPGPLR